SGGDPVPVHQGSVRNPSAAEPIGRVEPNGLLPGVGYQLGGIPELGPLPWMVAERTEHRGDAMGRGVEPGGEDRLDQVSCLGLADAALIRHVVQLSTEPRSEEHTSELQSRFDLVCRLPLEKKNSALI